MDKFNCISNNPNFVADQELHFTLEDGRVVKWDKNEPMEVSSIKEGDLVIGSAGEVIVIDEEKMAKTLLDNILPTEDVTTEARKMTVAEAISSNMTPMEVAAKILEAGLTKDYDKKSQSKLQIETSRQIKTRRTPVMKAKKIKERAPYKKNQENTECKAVGLQVYTNAA